MFWGGTARWPERLKDLSKEYAKRQKFSASKNPAESIKSSNFHATQF